MSTTVCLYANTIGYPQGGGHLWVYLNWALGLRACGVDVIWLEDVDFAPADQQQHLVDVLTGQLAGFGFEGNLALVDRAGGSLSSDVARGCLTLDDASSADLLLNLKYDCQAATVERFRRTALLDIDPGLVQLWMREGKLDVSRHDHYFTIGETVGQPGGIPDCGLDWQYTPPPVHLASWPVTAPAGEAPFTTVTHWWYSWEKLDGAVFDNSKRSSFLDHVELPRRVSARLELALDLGENEVEDRDLLQRHGWSLASSAEVAGSALTYRDYLQRSRGEFSCAKPTCMLLANAWISDRTICYLASGKPAVVQHTGDSRFLPDAEGLFRFRTVDEAVAALQAVEADYDHHAKAARALAEEHFNAETVVRRVLERALA